MTIENDEEKRIKSKTWYDDMCMWFALVMVVGGASVLGYAVVSNITDYIKGKKPIAKVRTLREQPKPESTPFNAALKNMQEKAK